MWFVGMMGQLMAWQLVQLHVLLCASALCGSSSSSSSTTTTTAAAAADLHRSLRASWLSPQLPPDDRALALLRAMNFSEKTAMLHGHPSGPGLPQNCADSGEGCFWPLIIYHQYVYWNPLRCHEPGISGCCPRALTLHVLVLGAGTWGSSTTPRTCVRSLRFSCSASAGCTTHHPVP